MRLLASFSLLVLLVLWSSCRSDFESTETLGNLEFSKDTVFLDTVFTGRTSSTYSLKVYNRSHEDVYIPLIQLSKGESSAYRLNVDGIPGKSFENIEILAKDSIYIFIETTVELQDRDHNQFLYEDHLQFISSSHIQEIPLVTLVKDAIFLFPSQDESGATETILWGKEENGEEIRVPGFFLEKEHLNMTSSKAYVIYGYAVVPPDRSLSIAAGARIYFHANSGLIVSQGATLNTNGTFSNDQQRLENEIIFQGDRLESDFENIPGQWGTIWLREGSLNNSLRYTTIKNASIGLSVHGKTDNNSYNLRIENSQIYNSAVNGIRGINANLIADNVVVNNSGGASVHLTGGRHLFRHSTVTNYWTQGYRESPALLIDDHLETSTNIRIYPLKESRFLNSIVYGNERQELDITLLDELSSTILFQNCLIRFESSDRSTPPVMDLSNPDYYQSVIANKDPFFWAPKDNDLRLQSESPAIDQGDRSTAELVPMDLLQVPRTEHPDLGAYERVK